MKKSDEIMAEYLLKGAKMLNKSCPKCGSPLFTVKGETYCVVCRENGSAEKSAPTNEQSSVKQTDVKIADTCRSPECAPVSSAKECGHAVCDPELYQEIKSAVVRICRRINDQTSPDDCIKLMQAASEGISSLEKIE